MSGLKRHPGFPENPLLAALLGWLPWLALLGWFSLGAEQLAPGLSLPELGLFLLAALGLSLIFVVLRLLPWTTGLRDPGLWMPQATLGAALMLVSVYLLPVEGRGLALLALLPWLALHGARLGSLRVGILLLFIAAVSLALPMMGLAGIPTQPPDAVIAQGLGLLLGGLALLVPLLALERLGDLGATTGRGRKAATGSDRPHILDRDELLAALTREKARCERRGVPFSVCTLALDGLNRLHLERGEAVCERISQAFGNCMLARARQLDVVGRRQAEDEAIGEYVGLDYVAVLPETPLGGGVSFANRIRHAMEQVPVRVEGESIRCTASAGVAQYRKGESLASLLLRAEDALHRAQRLGTNRVEKETTGGHRRA